MKIVTWNCNGAFRNKFHEIIKLQADLYVIQECENPAYILNNDLASHFDNRYLWQGKSKNRGIGVFSANPAFEIEPIHIDVSPLEQFFFFSVKSEVSFPVIATWTKQANSPTFQYIGQLWKLLNEHGKQLEFPFSILIGDLNSNKKWDIWDRWWNHSDVVSHLERLGLRSAYHEHFQESQGEESQATLYLHRNIEKAHHIDYAFLERSWLVENVAVGKPEEWLSLSDHMPVLIEVRAKERQMGV